MPDEAADERLLQRLNALKPSTVRLQREKKPLDFDSRSPGLDASPGINALYGSLEGFQYTDPAEELTPETLFNGDAVDELIASLNRPEGLSLQPSNAENVQSILSDATGFVENSKRLESTEDSPRLESKSRRDDFPEYAAHDELSSSSDEEADEAEAARYVEHILSEISEEPRHANKDSPMQDPDADLDPSVDDRGENNHNTTLSLPSVPTSLPTQKQSRAEKKPQREFCCVCYDTATTKCLDCGDNQFFCVRCWLEMHVGEEATFADQNQPHRRVKYEPSNTQ